MRKKDKWTFKPHYHFNPYRLSPDDDIDLCYTRYLADPTRIMRFGGRTYYKIIDCFCFTIRDYPVALAVIDAEMNVPIGDTLLDENGNRFHTGGPAYMSFHCPIPNWYKNTVTLELSGDVAQLGEYLTRK